MGAKLLGLIVIDNSCQQIILSERVRRDFSKTKLKWMGHLISWTDTNYGGLLVIFQK